MKQCPYCAEEIQDAAIVCRYCGKELEADKEKVKPKSLSDSASPLVDKKKTGFFQNKAVKASIVLTLLSTLSIGIKYSFGPEFFLSILFSTIPTFVIWFLISSIVIWIIKKTGIIWAIFIAIGLCLLIVAIGIILPTPFSSSVQPTNSQPPIPTHIPTKVKTLAPTAPTSTPTSNCIKWSKVSTAMIGSEACVYGNVYKTKPVGTSTTQILFSNNQESFFLAGGTYFYEVGKGDCVLAKGKILKSGAGVPYIDIDEALYKCESWMK